MDRYALGPKATGEGYERLRRALESVEASNDPGAVQRNTVAAGLYQFMPFWGKFVQEETGRPLKSFLPSDDSPAEMARSAKDQREILFPKYFEKEMSPWIAATRKSGLGKGRSDLELAIIYHKLGDQHATDYLQTGHDASKGTVDNQPIEQYVHAVASIALSGRAATDAAVRKSKYHGDQAAYDIALVNKAHSHPVRGDLHSNPRSRSVVQGHAKSAAETGMVASNKNNDVLSQFRAFNKMLHSNDPVSQEALNRIRVEGGGMGIS